MIWFLFHIFFFCLDRWERLDWQKKMKTCVLLALGLFLDLRHSQFLQCLSPKLICWLSFISAFGLHWCKKHANEDKSMLVDELDGKDLVDKREMVLEKMGEKNEKSGVIRRGKVNQRGRARRIGDRKLRRLKAKKRLRKRKNEKLKEKKKSYLGREKNGNKKWKEQSRREHIEKPRQPNSTESNMTSQYRDCSSKYKEYGLLALTKAATLIKQVIWVLDLSDLSDLSVRKDNVMIYFRQNRSMSVTKFRGLRNPKTPSTTGMQTFFENASIQICPCYQIQFSVMTALQWSLSATNCLLVILSIFFCNADHPSIHIACSQIAKLPNI